ncbi:MAG: ArsR family transcriptional regulator [Acetobacteraceae bacterium]|nr:ArsR family transcriptional regulator [Acetobacteraceae bacterium]
MEETLIRLRAAAEPTRLRLLALCGAAQLCVSDLVEVLGQSQPRLSRHLRLLTEAGLLERAPEGPHVYFRVPGSGPAASLARSLLAELPPDDPQLATDARAATRLAADRARAATASFTRDGADWEEARAIGLVTSDIEAKLLNLLPRERAGAFLDIGTGTGRLLQVMSPRVDHALGVDASRAMLALARARISEKGLRNCSVRHADMYRLPLADDSFDLVALQMVLHHAADPAAALAEAARVLAPFGTLLVVDLAPHQQALGHQHQGFSRAQVTGWLTAAGMAPARFGMVGGRLDVAIWTATRAVAQPAHAPAAQEMFA